MKHTNLFALAASMLLLASCGNGGNNSSVSSASAASSSSEASSSSSSRSRTRSSESSVSSSSSAPSEAALPDTLPTIEGTNVTFVEGMRSGGESDARANPGYLYEWHGDGGNISKFERVGDEYVIEYTGGWAWYGCQVFYTLPYGKAGDTYTVRLRLYSDVDGLIRVNGTTVNVVWGWNVITSIVTLGADDQCALSMQLGIPDEGDYIAQSLAGSLIKMKDIEIFDAVNAYHKVEFKVGDDVVKTIMVREGEKVSAPIVTPGEGKVFVGWYEGEEAANAGAPITAAHTFVAKIVNSGEVTLYNVSVMFNGAVYTTLQVAEGASATLEAIPTPFGYAIDAVTTDSAFTTPYEGAPITADTTLYLKAHVAPVTYYHEGQVAREERKGENGEFILEFHNHGYGQGWNIQVNFAPLTIGESGENYEFSCEYKITGTTDTGSWQIYDGASIAAGELPPSENFVKVTAAYEGGVLTSGNKFTMELGLVHPTLGDEGTVVVTVRNPSIVKKA